MPAHKLPVRKRNLRWQVDYRKLGAEFYPQGCSGGQKSYDTKPQANRAAQIAWDAYQINESVAGYMPPSRVQLALGAFRELEPLADHQLIDAVRLFKEHVGSEMVPRAVDDVIEDYLDGCKGNVADITIRSDYAPKLRRFGESFATREIHTVRTVELEAWLTDQSFGSMTRQSYRTLLVMLWKFAVARHYCKLNVAAPIRGLSRQQRKKLRGVPPAILCADELQSLLDAALAYESGRMLPYFALCGLSGVRPYEARKLSWSDFDVSERVIHIPAEACKTGDDREVPMLGSLVDWLNEVPPFQRSGPIPWTRHGFDFVRRKAGVLDRWREPKGADILRHSAASHHFRLHGDMALTALIMGHDTMTFRRHYKSRVRSMLEAEQYFRVSPRATILTIPNQKTA